MIELIHLYRNKWLSVKRTEMYPGYYVGETDQDGNLLSDTCGKVDVHDIVIMDLPKRKKSTDASSD